MPGARSLAIGIMACLPVAEAARAGGAAAVPWLGTFTPVAVAAEETGRTRRITASGSIGVDEFSPLRKHSFAPAAILTLQAPSRELNLADLRIYRTRWPALLHNCSINTAGVVGVGVRLAGVNQSDPRGDLGEPVQSTLSEELKQRPVDLMGAPGDLYLFNSEFVHTTPYIQGLRERIVLGAIVGLSNGSRQVEVWS